MNRPQVRRRFSILWWWQLVLVVLPVLIINSLFESSREPGVLAMPFFIAGMLSMFVSLPLFNAYKHALIATGKARDTEVEPAAWQTLGEARRKACWGAGLPAWIAAAAVFTSLEAVPLILLTVSSLVILYLYRIPRQLG
ncbi:MFS transporter [Pseudomonas sp. EL_65y_Pfl2_R95]|uniref:MFS transporter n=1 Tax=Pseudomonas sp. EL_65y_Pfl2_R95 TaxID=3088698 RepID=UPI0030DACC91